MSGFIYTKRDIDKVLDENNYKDAFKINDKTVFSVCGNIQPLLKNLYSKIDAYEAGVDSSIASAKRRYEEHMKMVNSSANDPAMPYAARNNYSIGTQAYGAAASDPKLSSNSTGVFPSSPINAGYNGGGSSTGSSNNNSGSSYKGGGGNTSVIGATNMLN